MKYSDRGLVKNGYVSPLFNHLYFVVAFFSTIASWVIIITSNFNFKQSYSFTLNLCLQSKSSEISYSNFLLHFFAQSLSAIVVMIFYIASNYFVNARKNGKLPPKMFGNYQRNLITFKETVVYLLTLGPPAAIICKVSIFISIQLNLFDNTTIRVMSLILYLILSFRVLILVVYLHFRINNVDIDVQRKVEVFYVNVPEIVPRRDYEMSDFDLNARNININIQYGSKIKNFTSYKQSKVINVKPIKKLCN